MSNVTTPRQYEDSLSERANGLLAFLLRAVDGAPGMLYAGARAVLRVASWLHACGLNINLLMYRLGLAHVTRLPAMVISVGNLSTGGTGKTMAVQRIVRELQAEGRHVAILSRGYRRKSTESIVVVSTPEGVLATPRDAGDEPCLLAHSLPGVPVLVGKNRRVTGRYAIETFGADTLVLDDGYQYWRLHKDREIVLLDALQPAVRDHLLPRGLFREPWSHLCRAQEVWITHAELADPARVTYLTTQVRRYAPAVTLRYTEHMPTVFHTADGTTMRLELLRGQRVLALSGLGNPRQFESMLTSLGADVVPCRYPDHYQYTSMDLANIRAQLLEGMLVVTTGKDAMRFPRDVPFPYWIAEAELCDVVIPDNG